jgi:hypothetical protein
MSKLSAGVEILVEQLKNNPDAFFGPIAHDPREVYGNPKFAGWRQAIEDERRRKSRAGSGVHRGQAPAV